MFILIKIYLQHAFFKFLIKIYLRLIFLAYIFFLIFDNSHVLYTGNLNIRGVACKPNPRDYYGITIFYMPIHMEYSSHLFLLNTLIIIILIYFTLILQNSNTNQYLNF